MSSEDARQAHPDDASHFGGCIDCHRAKYATPGMTAGEFAPYLPEHLRAPYWRQKLDEYFTAEFGGEQ